MTTMVGLLERERLVRRRPDPEDARATRVYLTENAKRFRPIAASVIAEIEDTIRQQSEPAEIEAVRAWLRRFSGV
jgi:DNA-binding MarR family transcriptional regulator